ncbi:hypothetical protein TNCT_167381 [Trichonephila clavata]|uniref:Uncharacterized protein n=1 Tax=Trichonephila clavata TaxID=2740835 RepID=A0A8X6IDH4_TRICU|nr:hypothetical protein TNCT_167381 [Trichonephila clavata]
MELLPAWMKGTTPEMDKKAEKELGENPEKRAEALKELRIRINGSRKEIRSEFEQFWISLELEKCKTEKGCAVSPEEVRGLSLQI